ncbi:MAG: DUF4956 domain-containing protein [Gemmatimonadales bacterium]
MTFPVQPTLLNRLADQPLARIAAYYLVLAVGVLALHRVAPDLPGVFASARFDPSAAGGSLFPSNTPSVGLDPLEATREALIAMLGAYLLMLPVAWVYILTRQKRGYQQSLVQTLIVLPIVVAAVVVLVKSSVALAFSLGGIVGAVAFRNRLEDTKDAVQIFLAIGVGLAAGSQVMSVALAMSLFYNLITLVLWWTDFGRAPAQLEGPPARRRLDELRRARARRTGGFVSEVDSLILKSMTPEQLSALADRAQQRRERIADQIGVAITGEIRRPKFDGTLRILTDGTHVEGVRRDAEAVLASQAKAYTLEAVTTADQGRQTVLYKIRFKKSVPGPLVVEAVRRAVAGRVSSVDMT